MNEYQKINHLNNAQNNIKNALNSLNIILTNQDSHTGTLQNLIETLKATIEGGWFSGSDFERIRQDIKDSEEKNKKTYYK
jgi:archaellum component FlaC